MSDILSERQAEAWPKVIEEITRCIDLGTSYSADVSEDLRDPAWEFRTNYGDINATWRGEDFLADVHMSYYGEYNIRIAQVDWFHHSDHDLLGECYCEACAQDREDKQESFADHLDRTYTEQENEQAEKIQAERNDDGTWDVNQTPARPMERCSECGIRVTTPKSHLSHCSSYPSVNVMVEDEWETLVDSHYVTPPPRSWWQRVKDFFNGW